MSSHTESPQGADHSLNGASEQSAFDWVADTARNNPTLVVGAAIAVGALAAIALSNRGASESRARSLERRLGRELASMERALRRNRPLSRMSDRLADTSAAVASRLGSWNTEAVEGFIRRAAEISSELARRRGL
ncbi:hypothetical protein [Hyphomicrobium sp. CS1BSMeth3]|uniref:hypothetical protein n=1 Tax=Hyphomicrobium sp. CS1BSMeth3 TaxID=1892844 RepID=UPI0009319ECD|nr:hypothetical protein [Hyphomicrobium sp. CS1BSMeth3]MBN9265507.1 hypothetical protein [Hyphomicrobium sp.]